MRLRYYQGGTEGVEYKLYSDEPKYYSEADSEKMKGVASVDYYVDCSNGQPIGQRKFLMEGKCLHRHFTQQKMYGACHGL